MKPNCYECKWRANLPGDCHSECKHPKAIFTCAAALGKKVDANLCLEISANKHGIKEGWFFWPMNFDPVWLDSCNGFEKL